MKLIISPAKRMKVCPDPSLSLSTPVFHGLSLKLRKWMSTLEDKELYTLLNCSRIQFPKEKERVAAPFVEDTAAVYAYDGIQMKQIEASSLNREDLQWLDAHLRIVSAMYGVLRPLDGIAPYRLQMNAGCPSLPSLYRFWDDSIAQELSRETDLLVDLSSKEYSKAVLSNLKESTRVLSVEFKAHGVWAKILRGQMVRYAMEHRIQKPEELKQFVYEGYSLDEKSSDAMHYVYRKA